MLQRFPVESKGRRKKLQEVCILFYKETFLYLSGLLFTAPLPLPRVNLPDPSNAGWLCDYHMLFMFPYQMRYG